MTIAADILIAIAALGAAVYCMILSRRLNRFRQLEGDMGTAIAVLSAQVDELTQALKRAQESASASAGHLSRLTEHADAGAKRLELVLASLHDIPLAGQAPSARHRAVRRRPRQSLAEEAA